jgi:hypothetical protein
MRFDVIVGNPPFNGKSSIHLKILEKMKFYLNKGGRLTFVMPKQILIRQAARNKKLTPWFDTCSMVTWNDVDMKRDFPMVMDVLITFHVLNDCETKMVDLTIIPPKSWSGGIKYVTGLDRYVCSNNPTESDKIPVINCVNDDGTPNYGRYTHNEATDKLAAHKGKPILHINSAGSMILRKNICWLDEAGVHPYYRHYMTSIVFNDITKAREVRDFMISSEGKAYITNWLKLGWGLDTALTLMAKPDEV